MSYYLSPSLGSSLELTKDCIVKGISVYDSIQAFNSNFTNLGSNITGTNMNSTGTAEVNSLISNTNLYGGASGFNILPKGQTVGIGMATDDDRKYIIGFKCFTCCNCYNWWSWYWRKSNL